ncbi:hypothetical protein EII34_07195 [Arachnia propionica]|uniref:Uncharacterized protein n=1 Tax=Arachnia propionica TaxID=1750 RepID=A0A3P1T8C1_9ACTN|nr:hypothetical protein [Arachnia propionica]RRD05508.1 hypothetical protein EII34_07195 [Arachnia propionica]
MKLTGTAFCCKVPEHWRENTTNDLLDAGSPFPVKGVSPRLTVQESTVSEHPEALAVISQERLRSLASSPETVVVQVEAVVRHGVERRRLWSLSPVTSEEQPEHIVTALTIRDLVIADGILAEAALTMALDHWKPGDSHHKVLDSLQLLPPGDRATPTATVTPTTPILDQWVTKRDGAPREDLSVVTPAQLIFPNGALTLSSLSARVFLNNLQSQGDHVPSGEVLEELVAAGLVDDDGHPAATGRLCAEHVLNGTAWRLSATPGSAELRFWLTERTTLLMLPHPDQQDASQLGFCSSDDLLRLLLCWVETTPSWPLDVELRMNRWQLRSRIRRHRTSTSRRFDDKAEFIGQPWTAWSLTDRWAQPQLTWLQTPTRGNAVTHVDPSLRNPLRLTTIRQDPEHPLWVHLRSALRDYTAPTDPLRR